MREQIVPFACCGVMRTNLLVECHARHELRQHFNESCLRWIDEPLLCVASAACGGGWRLVEGGRVGATFEQRLDDDTRAPACERGITSGM